MKSVDYLFAILKRAPRGRDGYMVHGRRYLTGAIPPQQGRGWGSAVCRCRYYQVFSVTDRFDSAEEAWEDFLGRKHPDVLEKWKKAEEN